MSRTKKLKTFNTGDIVYCRFFGNEKLLIEGVFSAGSKFPHYVCSLCTGEKYVVPKIHLSTKALAGSVDFGNRRQLSLDQSRPSRRV